MQEDTAKASSHAGPTHWAAVKQQCFGISRTKLLWIIQGSMQPSMCGQFHTAAKVRFRGSYTDDMTFLSHKCTHMTKTMKCFLIAHSLHPQKRSEQNYVPVLLEISDWLKKQTIHQTATNHVGVNNFEVISNSGEGVVPCRMPQILGKTFLEGKN